MAFAILFAQPFGEVPPPVLLALRQRLRDIATHLDSIPSTSQAWVSMNLSGLLLEVEGWRFQYRIDPYGRNIIVENAVRTAG